MLGFTLIALFVLAALASIVSLADSAVKMRNLWGPAKREAMQLENSNWQAGNGAIVVLKPAATSRSASAMPLAAAA